MEILAVQSTQARRRQGMEETKGETAGDHQTSFRQQIALPSVFMHCPFPGSVS